MPSIETQEYISSESPLGGGRSIQLSHGADLVIVNNYK